MNLVKDNMIFLQATASLPKEQVKALLRKCNTDQTRVIGEVSKNVLNHNLRLAEQYKSALKKHRRVIRALAEDTLRHKERLQIIVKNSTTVAQLIKAVLNKLIALVK